ncbi:MAG: hypothetical protein ABUK08_00030 [Candidatus Humimicrobiaceae bacterium]
MSTKQVFDILLELNESTELEAKKLVLDIHERLATDTPVDTGWAASNWIPSLVIPVTETAGSPEHISTHENVAGIAEILRWKFIQGPAFIANNVPYINLLNDGSSKKAPAGFIEADINSAVAKANKKRL